MKKRLIAVILAVILSVSFITPRQQVDAALAETALFIVFFELMVSIIGTQNMIELLENLGLDIQEDVPLLGQISAIMETIKIVKNLDTSKLEIRRVDNDAAVLSINNPDLVENNLANGVLYDEPSADPTEAAFQEWYKTNIKYVNGKFQIQEKKLNPLNYTFYYVTHTFPTVQECYPYVPTMYQQLFKDFIGMYNNIMLESTKDYLVDTGKIGISNGQIRYSNNLDDIKFLMDKYNLPTYYSMYPFKYLDPIEIDSIAIYQSTTTNTRIYVFYKKIDGLMPHNIDSENKVSSPSNVDSFVLYLNNENYWISNFYRYNSGSQFMSISYYKDITHLFYSGGGVSDISSTFTYQPTIPVVNDQGQTVLVDSGTAAPVTVDEDENGNLVFVPDTIPNFGEVPDSTVTNPDTTGLVTNDILTSMNTSVDTIKDTLTAPKTIYATGKDFGDIMDLFFDKMGLFYQLQNFLYTIIRHNYDPRRPEFTITFTGQLGIYGTYQVLDMGLYDQYRNYILNFMIATTWFIWVKRNYKKIPEILK